MIKDNFGRTHDYLRISLTDNCNLRCFYCMPEEDYAFTPASRLMQLHEIKSIAQAFVDEGVNKIRLTGGEPLVRKDAAKIILSLAQLPVKLTMTTNGVRLHEFLPVLEEANLKSLNISLDTLQVEKFQFLTRRDHFQRVVDNIHLLVESGFHVKVNMVVMKDLNDMEILDFIEWTKNTPIHVRFIEFMPFSGNQWSSNKVFTMHDILEKVATRYAYERLPAHKNDTAKAFQVLGYAGTFAIISTMTEHFCAGCNRMRLTADGKLKNCLFSKHETDILTPFRAGSDVVPLIHHCIQGKEKQLGGQLSTDFEQLVFDSIENRSMITIGG